MKHRSTSNNKLLSTLMLTLAILSFASCGDENEVLSEYKSGKVTRGELRKVVDLRTRGETPPGIPVEQQYSVLRDHSIMKILALEAKSEQMQKTPAYEQNAAFLEEYAWLDAYEKYVQNQVYRTEFEMIDMQFLLLRGQKDNQPVDRTEEATAIQKQLNSGLSDKEIIELIADKTEIPRYSITGGYVDPHCLSCKPDGLEFLTRPLKDAEEGKFITVQNEEGTWVVRKLSVYSVDAEDLEKPFIRFSNRVAGVMEQLSAGDFQDASIRQQIKSRIPSEEDRKKMAKDQASAWIRRRKQQLLQEKQREIQTASDLKIHEALKPAINAKSKNPEFQTEGITGKTPLFSIKDKTYTFQDLKKKFGEDEKSHPPVEQMLLMARGVWIPFSILKEKEGFQKAKETDFYDFIYDFRKSQLLARILMDSRDFEVEVDPQEVQNYYDMKKSTTFKGKPLARVRSSILQELKREKQQKKVEEFRNSLAEKYQLKIHKDRLKPGAI